MVSLLFCFRLFRVEFIRNQLSSKVFPSLLTNILSMDLALSSGYLSLYSVLTLLVFRFFWSLFVPCVGFETFHGAFRRVAHEWLDAATLARQLLSDGPLAAQSFNLETVFALDAQVWGQSFEPPVFCNVVEVVAQRLVGEGRQHLKLTVRLARQQGESDDLLSATLPVPQVQNQATSTPVCDAIWFWRDELLPNSIMTLAYRLQANEYNGRQRVQMVVEACAPAAQIVS
jgi:hypothetical protein